MAGEAEAEETTIHLPLVLRKPVQFIESSGALDTSFSQDGRVLTNFGGGDEWGRALVIQPDGKLVIAGFTFTGSFYDVVVARYHPDGSLDTTFDGDGWLFTDFIANRDYIYAVLLQPDGKIVTAGNALDIVASDFAVARYK